MDSRSEGGMSGKTFTPHTPLMSHSMSAFRTPDDQRVRDLRLALERERAELQGFPKPLVTPLPSRHGASMAKSACTSHLTPGQTPVCALQMGDAECKKSPDSGEKRVDGLRAAVWRGRAELRQLENMIQGRRRSLENYTPQRPSQPAASATCPRPRRPAFSPPTTKPKTSLRTCGSVGRSTLKGWSKATQSNMRFRRTLQRATLKDWRATTEVCKRLRKCATQSNMRFRRTLQRATMKDWRATTDVCKRLRKCAVLFLRAHRESTLSSHFYHWYQHGLRMTKASELQFSISKRCLGNMIRIWIARVRCIRTSEKRCTRAKRMLQRKAIAAWRRHSRISTLASDFSQHIQDDNVQRLTLVWHQYASRHRICLLRARNHLHLVHLRCMREIWYTWRSDVVNACQPCLNFKKLTDELLSAHTRRVFSSCYRRAVGKRAMGAIASRLLLASMRDSLNTMFDRNQELQGRINIAKQVKHNLLLPSGSVVGSSTVAYKLGGIAILKLGSCFATWVSACNHTRQMCEKLCFAMDRRRLRICKTVFFGWNATCSGGDEAACVGTDGGRRMDSKWRLCRKQLQHWCSYTANAVHGKTVAARIQKAAARGILRRALTQWMTALRSDAKCHSLATRFQARWAVRHLTSAMQAWQDAVSTGEVRISLSAVQTVSFRSLSAAMEGWAQHSASSRRAKRIITSRQALQATRLLARNFAAWSVASDQRRVSSLKLSQFQQRGQRTRCTAAVRAWRTVWLFNARGRRVISRSAMLGARQRTSDVFHSWLELCACPPPSSADALAQQRSEAVSRRAGGIACGLRALCLQTWVRYARRRRWKRELAIADQTPCRELCSAEQSSDGWREWKAAGLRRKMLRMLSEWADLCGDACRLSSAVCIAARRIQIATLAQSVNAWCAVTKSKHQQRIETRVQGRVLWERRLWFDAWKLTLDREVIPDTMGVAKRRRQRSEAQRQCLHEWRVHVLLQRRRWDAFEHLRRHRSFALKSQHVELWKRAAGVSLPPPLALHASSSSPRRFLLPPVADAEIAHRSEALLSAFSAWLTHTSRAQHTAALCEMLQRKARAMRSSKALCAWRLLCFPPDTTLSFAAEHTSLQELSTAPMPAEEDSDAEAERGGGQLEGGKEGEEEEEEREEEVGGGRVSRSVLQRAVMGWREVARWRRRAESLCRNKAARRAREQRKRVLVAWRGREREQRQQQQLVGVAQSRARGRCLKACVDFWMLKAASRRRLSRVGKTIAQKARQSTQRLVLSCWSSCAAFRELRAVKWTCQQDVNHRLLSYSFSLWQKLKYLIHCEKYLCDSRELRGMMANFRQWKLRAAAGAHAHASWTDFSDRLLLIHTLEHQFERATTATAPGRRESGTARPSVAKGRRCPAAQLRESKQQQRADLVHAWRQLAKAGGQSRRLAISIISRKAQRRFLSMAMVWWKTLAESGRRISVVATHVAKELENAGRRFQSKAMREWRGAAHQSAHAREALEQFADAMAWRRCDFVVASWRQSLAASKEVLEVAVACLKLKQKQEALHAWAAVVADESSHARGDRNNDPAYARCSNAFGSPNNAYGNKATAFGSPEKTIGRALQAISPNVGRSSSTKMKKEAPSSSSKAAHVAIPSMRPDMVKWALEADGATPLRLPVQVQYPKDPLAESGGRGVVEAQLIIDASTSRDDGLVEAEIISTQTDMGQLTATPRRGETHTVWSAGKSSDSSLVYLPVSDSRFASALPLDIHATPLRAALSQQYPPCFTPAHRSASSTPHRLLGSGSRQQSLQGCTPYFPRSAVKVPSPCIEDSRGSSQDRLSLDRLSLDNVSEPRTSVEPTETESRRASECTEGGRHSLAQCGGEVEELEVERLTGIERVLFGDKPTLSAHKMGPRGDVYAPPTPSSARGAGGKREGDDSPLPPPPSVYAYSPTVRGFTGEL